MKVDRSSGLIRRWKSPLMKGMLRTLDSTGVFGVVSRLWQESGVIFTLHHVNDGIPKDFSPNRLLSITPDYLDSVIRYLRERDYDLVSLTDACERIKRRQVDRRFACFTLDDGYKDNLEVALPVFQRNNVPFTVYIATSMPDGTAILWWDILESIILQNDAVLLKNRAGSETFECRTTHQKYRTFYSLYGYFRGLPPDIQKEALSTFFDDYKVDVQAHTRAVAMGWGELGQLALEPLCSIGAHTLTHPALSALDLESARYEVSESRHYLESRLGIPIEHFAYPFGDQGSASDREFRLLSGMDFKTGVTTRKGLVFPEHEEHLMALPRVSLNGEFQHPCYTRMFIEGGPFVISNRFKRLNVN